MPLVLPFPNIDPALFSIDIGSFTFSLRWYALAYLAGLLIALWMMVRLMKKPALWPANTPPMDPEKPESLLTWCVFGVILGGRLGFVAFYQPAYYLQHPNEILQVWNGGMSFHGGFIGVILATYFFAKLHKIPLIQLADAVAIVAVPGLLLGRLANFINGELWGRTTDVSWAMVFPHGGPDPRHPSQLYQAGLEGLALLLVLLYLAHRRGWLKRPGMITGMFFIGYGLARAFVENFREPDGQFITPDNPAGHVIRLTSDLGFTMGQTLSLPMIAIGLGFWAYSRRASAPA